MAYSPLEYRAINHFCEKNDAKPQLSTRPQIRFLMPDGKITERNILNLVSEYQGHKKELSKEQARQRKADKQKAAARR